MLLTPALPVSPNYHLLSSTLACIWLAIFWRVWDLAIRKRLLQNTADEGYFSNISLYPVFPLNSITQRNNNLFRTGYLNEIKSLLAIFLKVLLEGVLILIWEVEARYQNSFWIIFNPLSQNGQFLDSGRQLDQRFQWATFTKPPKLKKYCFLTTQYC